MSDQQPDECFIEKDGMGKEIKVTPERVLRWVAHYREKYPDFLSGVTLQLNKREIFSALIMQGMLASWPGGGGGFDEVAAKAVKAADALLKELGK